jgi:sortase A
VSEVPITSAGGAAHAGGALSGGRSRSFRAARALAVLLILAGALALADGIVTLVWQEPISALIAKLRQDHLKGELARVEAAPAPAAEQRELAAIADQRSRIAFLAEALQRSTPTGRAIGKIVIPSIGANFVMVFGTDTSDLESGPGLYRETTFPGIDGTTAIAGHRTTYLAPFRHIDALRKGQTIHLEMPYGRFVYTVIGHRVVAPTDVRAATANVGYSRVVLSACTPLFSAAKRLLVYGRLTRAEPRGAARLLTGGHVAQPLEYPLRPKPARRLPPVLVSLGPYYVSPAV